MNGANGSPGPAPMPPLPKSKYASTSSIHKEVTVDVSSHAAPRSKSHLTPPASSVSGNDKDTRSSGVPSAPIIEVVPPETSFDRFGAAQPDDEQYFKIGSANDIVVLRGQDGLCQFSDFHIMFDKKAKTKGSSAGSSLNTVNRPVYMYINGHLQRSLFLQVGEDGFCTFPDGTQTPPAEATKSINLMPGINSVRFEIRYPRDPRVLVAECIAFLWEASDPVVVVDIDGTITKSNIPGLLMTFQLKAIDTHAGICTLLNRISEEGAQLLYLTSRPIVLAQKTRTFLQNVKQDGTWLPMGPLLTCRDSLTDVVYREVIAKNMHEYKTAALLSVKEAYRRAGRQFGDTVFVAGIGNAETDALAYRAAGVPPDFIFIIDPLSNILNWMPPSDTKSELAHKVELPAAGVMYQSYSDSRFFELLKASLQPEEWEARKAKREQKGLDSESLAVDVLRGAEPGTADDPVSQHSKSLPESADLARGWSAAGGNTIVPPQPPFHLLDGLSTSAQI